MAQDIAAYGAETASLIGLDTALVGQLAELDAAGIAATQTLSGMIDQASQSANLNAKAAALAGLAMQNLLQLRLGVAEMIETPQAAQLAAATSSAEASHAALVDLRATFFRTDDLERVDSVLAALAAYHAEVQAVFARLSERETLRTAHGDLEILLEQASVAASDANAARQAEAKRCGSEFGRRANLGSDCRLAVAGHWRAAGFSDRPLTVAHHPTIGLGDRKAGRRRFFCDAAADQCPQ